MIKKPVLGMKVKVIKNLSSSINKVGSIGTITEIKHIDHFRVTVDGVGDYGNWTSRWEVRKLNIFEKLKG